VVCQTAPRDFVVVTLLRSLGEIGLFNFEEFIVGERTVVFPQIVEVYLQRITSRALDAELVEGGLEKLGDLERVAALDIAAVEHVDRLAVLEQRHRRAGRRKLREDRAHARYRCFIGAGEYGSGFRRAHRMLQRHAYRGTGAAGRTAANRIHNHEDGSIAGSKKAVDIGGGSGFFDAELRKIRAHGSNKLFGIRHCSDSTAMGGPRWTAAQFP
jgi:hypothetical protein